MKEITYKLSAAIYWPVKDKIYRDLGDNSDLRIVIDSVIDSHTNQIPKLKYNWIKRVVEV